MENENTVGTLKIGEFHPAAQIALDYIKSIPIMDAMKWREALASCSLSGCRNSEIASETWRRLDAGEPVSDRYLMGLAWLLFELESKSKNNVETS